MCGQPFLNQLFISGRQRRIVLLRNDGNPVAIPTKSGPSPNLSQRERRRTASGIDLILTSLIPPINHSVLHHKHNLLHRVNILQRIATNRDDVGPLSNCQ